MKKKMVRNLAIINALGLPIAAHAGIEVYGTASAALEHVDIDTPTNYTEVSNNHSAFGVKGSTDIGSGVEGVFLYDLFVGLDSGDSGTGTLFGGGRDGYIGLKGAFGTVALGFHGRPWKTSTNHIDIFGSTLADYSAIMGSTASGNVYFDGGIGNSFIWFAPKLGNVSGHVQIGADEGHDGSDDSGIQINYSTGPLYASVSHDIDGQNAGEDITATKLAVTYEMAATQVAIMFENISDGGINTRSAWWLGVTHQTGKFLFKVAAASAADSDALGLDDGASYFAIGVDHMYSPNLTAYILYASISNDDAGAYTFHSDPHTSSNGNAGAAATGADSSVIALGIRYNFSWKSK